MNLRQIEIFVAVADSGSFSRGAETALLTQSTISQHIAALESECGARLLDRTGRGAVPTEEGKLFLRHARRVLSEVEALRQAMVRFQGLEEARLTIGASNIPADYLIPQILPTLAARHPGIELSVVAGDSREMLNRLLAGQMELVLIGNRFDEAEIDFVPIAPDLLALVVGRQHPWRGRESVRIEDLPSMPIVVRESGSGSDLALRAALQKTGFDLARLRIAARLGSNEAIKQAVAGGFCMAFLSETSVRREVRQGELFVIPVEDLAVERHFWLATRAGRSLSPPAAAFILLLKESAGAGSEPARSSIPSSGNYNRRE